MSFDHKTFLTQVTQAPGVYQMLGEGGVVLYVGKAKNLKKRLAQYFQKNHPDPKTRVLVKQIKRIEVTVTSENEALLLENNLIKHHRPRYNVLLRDDKSYPYIFLSAGPYPRIDFHRGQKKKQGDYFGPFPDVQAVRKTINWLQKIFRIRQCKDSFFANRTRPCLLYQIHRCTAPCVKYIDEKSYQQDVENVRLFLSGKNQTVIEELIIRMEKASMNLQFEIAARYRDQITALRHIQQTQYVNKAGGNIDVIAIATMRQVACVNVLSIRQGIVVSTMSYFPTLHQTNAEDEIMAAFISQYYLNPVRDTQLPEKIILNKTITEKDWLSAALTELKGKKIAIQIQGRNYQRQWLTMSLQQAQASLRTHLANQIKVSTDLLALQALLHMEATPLRMECFDVSHTQGEATVAACVVFDQGLPNKTRYRRFNITGIQKNDDYAALSQALLRHYTKLKRNENELPQLLLIDGGKGQLHVAEKILDELQIHTITLVGIAKGPERKPGLETLFMSGCRQGIHCASDSPALHLIQRIRDEAHRFAITGHRQQRGKTRRISTLEAIPGIGVKRRRLLLTQFGGLAALQQASIDDIAKIPGFHRALAQRVYEAIHDKK